MINSISAKSEEREVDKVVEAVVKKQRELGLTETDMSKKLGISRPMWYLLKHGVRKPEKDFLGAVSFLFPDLQILVHQELIEIGKIKTAKD